MYSMPDCWLEVSQKVLRPANPIKVFRGFPWSQSKRWVGTQIPVALHASHAAPPAPHNGTTEKKNRPNVGLLMSD
jgi:hypothetical protein